MIRKFGMAALAACTISALATTMGWSADKPVFGLVMSFSGWFPPIDADTIAGAKLAVDEINAAGGVLGQPIEVVEFDNKSEPPLGADGAVDVIGKGAKAILFPERFRFWRARRLRCAAERRDRFFRRVRPEIRRPGRRPARLLDLQREPGAGRAAGGMGVQGEGLEDRLRPSRQHDRLYQIALRQLCARAGKNSPATTGLLGQDTFLNGDPFDRRAGDAHHRLAAKNPT